MAYAILLGLLWYQAYLMRNGLQVLLSAVNVSTRETSFYDPASCHGSFLQRRNASCYSKSLELQQTSEQPEAQQLQIER